MRKLVAAALLLFSVSPLAAQTPPPLNVDSLRANLYALAADSMGGRQTGSLGDWKAQEWVAAELKAAGWLPAGENGGYFQVIPFLHVYADTAARIGTSSDQWIPGRNLLPMGPGMTHDFAAVPTVYGGSIDAPEMVIDSAGAAGKIVVLSVPDSVTSFRSMFGLYGALLRGHTALAQARGVALAGYDRLAPDLVPQILAGSVSTDTSKPNPAVPPRFPITPRAAEALFGPKPKVGASGATISGSLRWIREPLPYVARNVVAMLPGSDPALRAEFVSMSAHHDHVGFTGRPVDHDSVVRLQPGGSDPWAPTRPSVRRPLAEGDPGAGRRCGTR